MDRRRYPYVMTTPLVLPFMVYLFRRLAHAELQQNARPFECLWCAPGSTTFHIRHIGELTISPEMIELVVANFQRFDRSPPRVPIEVNHQGDSGNIHESRAVAWIVDLSVERTAERVSLMVHPSWSDEAKQVIEAGGFRYCSVGLELNALDAESGNTIGPRLREVSLTGHPAIPGLRPIELSVPLDFESKVEVAVAEMAHSATGPGGEPDMLDRAHAIAKAFYQAFPDSDVQEWYIKAVFFEARQMVVEECIRQVGEDGAVAIDRMWQLPFRVDDEEIGFGSREEWIQVEQQFVPVEAAVPATPVQAKSPLRQIAAAIPERDAQPGGSPESNKAENMDKITEQLTAILATLGIEVDLTAEEPDLSPLATEAARLKATENELDQVRAAAEKAKAAAAKDLTDSERKVVVLSTRADAAEETVTKLSSRIETLETEKNEREADAAIDAAIRAGKMLPAEVAAKDAPMRLMAHRDRATFHAILEARPKQTSLTQELSYPRGEPVQVDTDEYWTLVAGKKTADQNLNHQQAQDLVMAERPEFRELFKAATAAVRG